MTSRARARWRDLAARSWPPALLASVAYLPPLATARGWLATDTKAYLYLDPGRLLERAASLWDPSIYGGYVTHQTIGYLWPMGPWYWVFEQLGSPDWVAQRLWLGSLFFAAGAGAYVCARLFGFGRLPALATAALYQLSPYALAYAHRTSVLLLPWAGLGWMLALTVRAARRGGWRDPALFALVVVTVGGVNATAILLAGLAPVLWLIHAALPSGELDRRRALATAGRIGLLTAGTCAFWLVALWIQSGYGADVLAYSETLEAVSSTALASEVWRGLGYWLFYGGDVTGRWTSASTPYLQSPGLLLLGFGLAAAAVAAAVAVRWRERRFLVVLAVVGLVVAVSTHPYDDPSPYGALVKWLSGSSTAVLALRSSTRATPLLLLALALLAGAALTALAARRPRVARGGVAAVVVLAVLNLPALWNGSLVDQVLRRPSDVPSWWHEAAAHLDDRGERTRVLELPGQEFAAYRWGTAIDPILPGLTDRPVLTRDLLPLGGPAAMDLLNSLDTRLQAGVFEPASLAPVARLLGVGDVVLRNDAAFERYRTARPELVWQTFGAGVPGLGGPTTFGDPQPNVPSPHVPAIDETALSEPDVGAPLPPVAVFPVEDPLTTVRARASGGVLLSGSGDGVVDAAAAGLVDGHELLRYSASLDGEDEVRAAAEDARLLVVTDTNRKRATQWRGSQDTTGFTEDESDGLLGTDTADARLPVFPDAGADAFTVAEQRGGARAVASAYGEPAAYRPEDRAVHAIDGDPATAWQVGDRAEVHGARLRIELERPRDLERATIVQSQVPSNRAITAMEVTTEAGSVDVALDDRSRRTDGQAVALPSGRTSWVELEVTATDIGERPSYFGVGPVGLAEVDLAGVDPVEEVVRLPRDLLGALGDEQARNERALVLTRLRVDPRDRWRRDEEARLVRAFDLPARSAFELTGTARVSASAPDGVLDRLLGTDDGVTVRASTRLEGVLAARGRAALDGDPATAWTSAFGAVRGASLEIELPRAARVDRLALVVVADARHSVPTELTVEGGGERRVVPVALPPGEPGAVRVPVRFEPFDAARVRVTVTGRRDLTTVDRRSGEPVVLPVAIAELGLPGARVAALPRRVDSRCRDDLLTVDGRPAPVRVTGTLDRDRDGGRGPLAVRWCGPERGLDLDPGEHVVRAADGVVTGLDLDRLVLRAGESDPAATAPQVELLSSGRTERTARVRGAGDGDWIVLGESHNDGWHASASGRDLGASQVVDGGANGWRLPSGGDGGPIEIRLEWRPQRAVRAGLAASAAAVAACLGIVALSFRRRRTVPPVRAADLPGLRTWTGGRPLAWRPALVRSAAAGLLAAAILEPLAGPAVALAMLVAARRPAWRAVLGAGAVAAVLAIAGYYVVRQVGVAPLEGFGWPGRFGHAHPLGLLAAVLLAADALLDVRSARQERP